MAQHMEPQSASWLSSLTNMVGNMFVSEEGGVRTQQIRYGTAHCALLQHDFEAHIKQVTVLLYRVTLLSLCVIKVNSKALVLIVYSFSTEFSFDFLPA
jgi:hypothetical protein